MRFTSWAVFYITCFSQVGLLFCSRLFATMSRASGKPMCPCGRTTLSQLTHKALITWAEFEGERWTWHSSNQACFKYCEACHMFVQPRDGRYRGPHCKPGSEFSASGTVRGTPSKAPSAVHKHNTNQRERHNKKAAVVSHTCMVSRLSS